MTICIFAIKPVKSRVHGAWNMEYLLHADFYTVGCNEEFSFKTYLQVTFVRCVIRHMQMMIGTAKWCNVLSVRTGCTLTVKA